MNKPAAPASDLILAADALPSRGPVSSEEYDERLKAFQEKYARMASKVVFVDDEAPAPLTVSQELLDDSAADPQWMKEARASALIAGMDCSGRRSGSYVTDYPIIKAKSAGSIGDIDLPEAPAPEPARHDGKGGAS